MDQKFRNDGALITTILVGFCGFLCLPLGIGLLLSYPVGIWWLGPLLLGSSGLLFYSAWSTYRKGEAEAGVSREQLRQIKRQLESRQDAASASERKSSEQEAAAKVLCHWTYSPEEWSRFVQWERKERKTNVGVEGMWLVVLGVFILWATRQVDWKIAFAISAFVAVVYSLLKYNMTLASISLPKGMEPNVIITPEAVVVNGHMNRLVGFNLWIDTVAIKEEKGLNYLEITYRWTTRGGETFDEIRVPIPDGKVEEAFAVQKNLPAPMTEVVA